MSARNDVPSAADIFLKKKPVTPRRPRIAMPGLFDALEVAETHPEVPPPQAEPVPLGTPQADPARVWSVAEIVREVRSFVETQYARITIEGEISNWRPAASGHCYFTLKDGGAQLSVVMFRREAALLRFKPKDGDAVRMRGQVSVYESRGQMQLIAETMELAGVGAQLAAVQELKSRLKREGVFDNKRPLPAFPRCIGIITSLQGAALRDIVKVCRRRHAAVNLLVYPAAVQGPRCPVEVVAGLRWFNAHKDRADVILVARGGGSWEDLHGFDDERVARAIAASSVPVVAGIGHATDTTIADAAADICAPTPSAAAELVTATQYKVEERVFRLGARLRRASGYELLRARQRLSRLSADSTLRSFRDALSRRAQRLDELDFRLHAAIAHLAKGRADRLSRANTRLQRQDVRRRLAESMRQLEVLQGKLQRAGTAFVSSREVHLAQLQARADAMSPLRVLERGYALVYGPDGKLLRSAREVNQGDALVARLAVGSLQATVTTSR